MTQVIFNNPVALGVLTLALIGVILWQATLPYKVVAQINRGKRLLFPPIERFKRPLVKQARKVSPTLATVLQGVIPHLIHDKGRTNDDEYIKTWECSRREAFDRLKDAGLNPNVASSLKRRPGSHGQNPPMQLSVLSMVQYHDDGTQTEFYVFDNGNGSVDIYAHNETSITDPKGHLNNPQVDGDPKGVLSAV